MTKARIAAAAVVTVALALGTPRSSDASHYVWNVDADGSWTDASKWQHIAGSGPDTGFPNRVGDVALFTITYTAFRRVTVPAGVDITVGALHFTGSHTFEIARAGDSSTLRFDNGAAGDATLTSTGPGAPLLLDIVVQLADTFVVTAGQNRLILFVQTIQDGGIGQAIRKDGPGMMSVHQRGVCHGSVTVEHGRLDLVSQAPGSITCPLFVGDGVGTAGSAEVNIHGPDQIGDHVNVVVRADGRLSCLSRDQIFDLDVTDGIVSVIGGFSRLTVRDLNMAGGLVETLANAQLRSLGHVTATSSVRGPARMQIPPADAGTRARRRSGQGEMR